MSSAVTANVDDGGASRRRRRVGSSLPIGSTPASSLSGDGQGMMTSTHHKHSSPQRRAARAAARAAKEAAAANMTPTTTDEDDVTTTSEGGRAIHHQPPRFAATSSGAFRSNPFSSRAPYSNGYGGSSSGLQPFSGLRSVTAFMAFVMVSLMVMILFLLQRISSTLTAVAPSAGGIPTPNNLPSEVVSPSSVLLRTAGIRGKQNMKKILEHNLSELDSTDSQKEINSKRIAVSVATTYTAPEPITFDKAYNDLTYDDIPFQPVAHYAPSCDAPLDAADISFTLVTQVSEDRLWMLTQHCQRWPAMISVAVFTDKTVEQLEAELDKEGETYAKCGPRQVLFSVLSKSKFKDAGYPVNALRNLAFSKVTTSHFMYADIDFWVSTNLHDILNLEFVRKELAGDSKLAIVVPAFQIRKRCNNFDWDTYNSEKDPEPECRDENIPRMPKTFDDLTELLVNHQSSAFDPTNRGGHGSTSYREWFRMGDGELWDIPCILSNRYEPYLAARWCDSYPPYQEVFTGYGKNKMTQIMQMRRSGYIFSQVGGVFVCHYPHPVGKSREIWNAGREERKLYSQNRTAFDLQYGTNYDWYQYKRGQVDKLFVEYKRWLDNKIPAEMARTPMCEDQFNDDLKLWLNAEDRIQQLGEWLLAEEAKQARKGGGNSAEGGAGDDERRKADDDDSGGNDREG